MENKTPEKILNDYWNIHEYNIILDSSFVDKVIICAMKEYGKQRYNQAVLDCIENAKVKSLFGGDLNYKIDKESMKKLLKQ